MSGFIAVHAGAGYHAKERRKPFKQACKKSCIEALKLIHADASAVEIVATAVSVLEDSSVTNAGFGSNLTVNGNVECDAAIMDGSSLLFGSVGAIYGLKNPIRIAQAVLMEQNHGLLSGGRVPPCTLVGRGAVEWARNHGFNVIESTAMISEDAKMAYSKFLPYVSNNAFGTKQCDTLMINDGTALDTVGAVAVDSAGNIASAVSSGGLLMKHPGRIGQAAVHGAGCWAESDVSGSKIGISVSGVGEYLMRTTFAKECFKALNENQDSTLPTIFKKKFVESPYLNNIQSKRAGVLVVKNYLDEKMNEVIWAHNSRSFLISYMTTSDHKPHFITSEKIGAEIQNQHSIVSSGKSVPY